MSEHLLIKILLDLSNTKLGDWIIANFLISPRRFLDCSWEKDNIWFGVNLVFIIYCVIYTVQVLQPLPSCSIDFGEMDLKLTFSRKTEFSFWQSWSRTLKVKCLVHLTSMQSFLFPLKCPTLHFFIHDPSKIQTKVKVTYRQNKITTVYNISLLLHLSDCWLCCTFFRLIQCWPSATTFNLHWPAEIITTINKLLKKHLFHEHLNIHNSK